MRRQEYLGDCAAVNGSNAAEFLCAVWGGSSKSEMPELNCNKYQLELDAKQQNKQLL